MPSLKAIRRRIVSVKSTQQITKAMKMVAAAKLRRAQNAIVDARPYAKSLGHVLGELAARAGGEAAHPLLARREERKVMFVVFTSDRGLCGGFNSTLLRRFEREFAEKKAAGIELAVTVIGRKGKEYLARRGYPLVREYVNQLNALRPALSTEIANGIIEAYSAEQLDAVYLVYNEFKSAISQKVTVEKLLPIVPEAELQGSSGEPSAVDFIYEPAKAELLAHVLPKHVSAQLWRCLLESVASELGAKMTAMDAATTNAGEMISKLSLSYNRARQAAITKELMEIVSGAESLKG